MVIIPRVNDWRNAAPWVLSLLFSLCAFLIPFSTSAQWVAPDSLISISELKNDFDNYNESDSLGRRVIISGIANVPSGLLHETYLQTYVQNDSVGISIFGYEIDEPIAVGDSVVVEGREKRYFGQPELQVDDYRVYRKEKELEPIPLYRAFESPEKYQAMLVEGSGIVTEKGNKFNGKYLKIAPSDTSSVSVMIYVSNFHKRYQDFDFSKAAVGDEISVTGVLGQFDPAYPEATTFKVFLRTPDDFSYVGWPAYYFKILGIALVVIILGVLVWLFLLRREVKRKTRELETSLQEKEVLLKEIHHRVKNNLAAISGILELQSGNSENEEFKRAIRESQTRIKSMAMVHEKLYQSTSLKNIPMRIYLKELSESIRHTFASPASEIDIRVKADQTELIAEQVIPLGLLVNELLVNSFKYAFNGEQKGIIRIELSQEQDTIMLLIEDNGVGLPKEFEAKNADSLGMVLVNVFAQQLDAVKTIKNTPGACFIFKFPVID